MDTTSCTLADFESSLENTGFELSKMRRDGALLPPPPSPAPDLQKLIDGLPRITTDGSGSLVRGRTLGKGGMGVVRAAEQRSMGRDVAIKSLNLENLVEESTILLLREAWVVGMLEHPNIVPVYEVGLDDDGGPVIVMKRIEGTPWSDYIRGEVPLLPEAVKDPLQWHLRVLMQVCNAVHFASTKGIVHRDLKPSNVMIGRFGEVYVMDWGLAVSLEDNHDGRLLTKGDIRGIAGTPGYMAPEMIDEQGTRIGTHTDIYLLGAILHEVILGVPRHRGRTTVEMMYSSFISDAFNYPPIVPRALARLANRAMSPDPADRFEDAEVFRKAIAGFLGHQSAQQLVNEAARRLEVFRERMEAPHFTDLDRIAADNLFAECRFAYQQALRDWPDNESAKRGLQECHELMVEYELQSKNAEAAKFRLAELPAPRSDLTERVRTLVKRDVAKEREYESLKRQEADRDLRVGSRARSLFSSLLALVWTALPAGLGTAERAFGIECTYPMFFLAAFVAGAIGVAVHLVLREALGKTMVDRQLAMSLYFAAGATLLSKLAGLALGLDVQVTMLFDLMLFAVVGAMAALTIERKLALVVAVFLVGFTAGLRNLDALFFISAATELVAFLVVAFIWLPVTEDDSAEAEPSTIEAEG